MNTSEQVLAALAQADRHTRQNILSDEKVRSLISITGANVTLFSGTICDDKTGFDKLSNISVLLALRQTQSGEQDGIGALGGLSECIHPLCFYQLNLSPKSAFLGVKDNVILDKTGLRVTRDKTIIDSNNLKREMNEELGNVGVSSYDLPWQNLHRVPIDAKDDSYILNRWTGKGPVFCVNPNSYTMCVHESTINDLVARSNLGTRECHSELSGLKKYALTDVLNRYGTGDSQDYHYPHEWISVWFLAANLLDNPADKKQVVDKLRALPAYHQAIKQMQVSDDAIQGALMGIKTKNTYDLVRAAHFSKGNTRQ